MLYLAEVVEVLTDDPGLRVQFRDLVRSGAAPNTFVRVLCPRMHAEGAAGSYLPDVGELGLVAEIFGGNYIWLGSLPFLDGHQLDMTPGLAFWRHESGITLQARKNGSCEFLHPSGFRVTVAGEDGPLDPLLRTSIPPVYNTTTPGVEIDHPSGLSIKVSPDGGLSVSLPSGSGFDFNEDGGVAIFAGGDVDLSAAGTVRVNGADGIELSGSDSMTITTMGDCAITAGGDCSIVAAGDVSVETDSNVEVTALKQLNVSALMGMTLTGSTISLMGVGTLNGKMILTSG